jgi:hypothetical protein
MPETQEEPESAGNAKHEASTSRSSISFGADSPTRESGSRGSQSSPVTAGTGEAPKKRRKVNHGQKNPACQSPYRADFATRTACVYCRRSVSHYLLLSKLCDGRFTGQAHIRVFKIIDGLTGSMFGYTAYDLRCGTTSSTCVFTEATYSKKSS